MIQHHISTKNKPPPQAELIPSVSHPNQNSSVKKASLLTPVLPTTIFPDLSSDILVFVPVTVAVAVLAFHQIPY